MLLKRASDIPSSEITDKKMYLRRREFLETAAALTVGSAIGGLGGSVVSAQAAPRVKIPGARKDSGWGKGEKTNSYEDITSYNNFYEFGTDKGDPAVERAHPQDDAVEGES